MTRRDITQTDPAADLSDVQSGKRITLDELAVSLSAARLMLRKLARAAETPDTPVELSDTIKGLGRLADDVGREADHAAFLARVVVGDVPLAKTFKGEDPWGTAARGTDREDFGGPAIIPTQRQLIHLAQQAKWALAHEGDEADTTTYPEAMEGVGLGFESKEAQARRRRERDALVAREARLIPCERCAAGEGELCRTNNGRVASAYSPEGNVSTGWCPKV
ncbi:hypothetical protein GCM10023086_74780 [Streptomyces venetus]|uniref:Uncharacterized protein n=1 Tax=Streptomyces venetus TaxID=1701086 RepID=A0ABP8HIF2_9ACTN